MIKGIHSRKHFSQLRELGAWFSLGPLRCVGVADPSVHPPEVAIAIKNRMGSAVVRNRLRRRLRHALTCCFERGTLADGRYLLVVRSADLPAGEHLQRQLADLFRNYHL